MAGDALTEAIGRIPFEDHHVHQPLKRPHALTAAEFRQPFTEAAIPAVWEEAVPTQLAYRWLVRELARLLGTAPDEVTVLAARNSVPERAYHRLLADSANLGAAYADDLFLAGQGYPLAEWAALIGRPVHRLLRLETFVEQGYPVCPTLDDARARLTDTITAAPANGIVGLKSIAGYRCGLAVTPPSREQYTRAVEAYARVRQAALVRGAGRLADKDVIDTLVWAALEAAIPMRLPLQFHVALGDDDIILARNDPILLRPLLTHEPFRVVPLVLLHCYPYHRQAAYLASLYPNVYVDLGLTIPLVGPGAARVLEETLELVPTRQLLASTDGHLTPEFQWFGVFVWRWALAQALGQYVAWGVLDGPEALGIATAVLRENSRRIYRGAATAG